MGNKAGTLTEEYTGAPKKILTSTDIIPADSLGSILKNIGGDLAKDTLKAGLAVSLVYARLVGLGFLIVIAIFIFAPSKVYNIFAKSKVIDAVSIATTTEQANAEDDISDLELDTGAKDGKGGNGGCKGACGADDGGKKAKKTKDCKNCESCKNCKKCHDTSTAAGSDIKDVAKSM
jgi:hypothetical protein